MSACFNRLPQLTKPRHKNRDPMQHARDTASQDALPTQLLISLQEEWAATFSDQNSVAQEQNRSLPEAGNHLTSQTWKTKSGNRYRLIWRTAGHMGVGPEDKNLHTLPTPYSQRSVRA